MQAVHAGVACLTLLPLWLQRPGASQAKRKARAVCTRASLWLPAAAIAARSDRRQHPDWKGAYEYSSGAAAVWQCGTQRRMEVVHRGFIHIRCTRYFQTFMSTSLSPQFPQTANGDLSTVPPHSVQQEPGPWHLQLWIRSGIWTNDNMTATSYAPSHLVVQRASYNIKEQHKEQHKRGVCWIQATRSNRLV
ncbi:hypothetical protein HaLaN_18227 [Haematococcus lacustris]|uniref:Secreted protein n=1 Tax=Haematococcus lacustris TaxID=44745 RepID=A0A699ZFN0_HAELA|nr:hypothetical protein HaLaN_18227 [Haematococcus lacustris]